MLFIIFSNLIFPDSDSEKEIHIYYPSQHVPNKPQSPTPSPKQKKHIEKHPPVHYHVHYESSPATNPHTPEDEQAQDQTHQESKPKIHIQLRGFGENNNDVTLKSAFAKFIQSIKEQKEEEDEKLRFPYKISRTKNLLSRNIYVGVSIEKTDDLSKKSISISGTQEPITDENLKQLLDREKVISKIIILPTETGYEIIKFGVLHSAKRGAVKAAITAAFGSTFI